MGRCLGVAPIHGIQLWAKPMASTKVAIFLVNTLAQPQAMAWPIADVPSFNATPGVARVVCAAGRCSARDVWKGTDVAITSPRIPISLQPYASAFFILTDTG